MPHLVAINPDCHETMPYSHFDWDEMDADCYGDHVEETGSGLSLAQFRWIVIAYLFMLLISIGLCLIGLTL